MVPTDQISGRCLQVIVIVTRPAIFDGNVAAFDIALPAQALTEGAHARGKISGVPALR